jgi:hypothetical protein
MLAHEGSLGASLAASGEFREGKCYAADTCAIEWLDLKGSAHCRCAVLRHRMPRGQANQEFYAFSGQFV